MGELGKFEWPELISLVAVCISFITICINMFGRSQKDAQQEQKLIDRLDTLTSTTNETRDDVKTLSSKIDDYGNRLTKAETDIQSIYRRVGRIEATQDHCQACRKAKAEMGSS